MKLLKKPFFLLPAVILLLTGCAVAPKISPTATVPPPASVSPSPTDSLTTQSPSPPAATKNTAPPSQLDAINTGVEDIFTDIEKSDWAAANAGAEALKTNFGEIKASLDAQAVLGDAVTGMEAAVTELLSAIGNKNNYDARLQANTIEKYLADVYDVYKVFLPTDLIRMRYLARQIALEAEKADWNTASGNCREAGTMWNTLKAQLNAATFTDDLNKTQTNIEKLKSAVDKENGTDTPKYAGSLIANLRLIENDFKKQLSI